MQDLIQMMVQVNTTLCDLERFGRSHQSISPERILMKRTDDGSVYYKLAAPISSIPISGKKYEERMDYLPYIAQGQVFYPNSIKSDVFSLAMTFLWVAGVSRDNLMKIRSGALKFAQQTSQDDSALGELIQLVLQAVNYDYSQRLHPKEFGERLYALLLRASNQYDFTISNFVAKFEERLTTDHQIFFTAEPGLIQLTTQRKDEDVEVKSPQTGLPAESRYNKQRTERNGFSCGIKAAINFTSLILTMLTLGIGIPILYKGYVNLKTSDALAGAMGYIYENLNTVPFSSFTIAEGACPSGYTSISELGNWGGTVGFCYDLLMVDTEGISGKCENYYEELASQSYSSWKNITLCAQPVAGFSNSSQCSVSQTSCYTGVCVTGTQCPISEVQFSTSALSSDGWTSVQYNASLFINYRQDSGILPLSTFRINIGEAKSCLSSHEYSSQKSYAANIFNSAGCNEYGSFPNSKAVDTENSLLTFYAQTWSSEVLKLPGYAELLNSQTAYLTASPRIELIASCSSMSFDSLKVGAGSLRTIHNMTVGFGLATIIAICLPLLIVFAIVVVIVACSRICGRIDRECVCLCGMEGDLMEVGFKCGMIICYPITAIVLIIAAALTRSNFKDFDPYFDDYDLITQNACFVDGTVQSTVQAFIDAIGTTENVYHLWIGLAVAYWVIFVVWIFLVYRSRKDDY